MTQIVVDAALRARLNLAEHLELLDESGQPLGHYLPAEAYWKLQMAADGCPYTYEDLQRARQEKEGRPLAEILQDLVAR